MLLGVPCYTGSIPSELGNLIALQGLDLSSNEVAGESNVCPGVSGTFVVSDGAHVSNGIHDVEEENHIICFKKMLGIFFLLTVSSNASNPSKTTVLGTLGVLLLHFSGNRVKENECPPQLCQFFYKL